MPIAFVGGATGYTGRAVVSALLDRGVQTWAHVRPDSPKLDEWEHRFKSIGAHVDTTAWEDDALAARLKEIGPDAVFGCLGTTKKRVAREAARGEKSSYRIVDYGLTVMLHAAAEACGTDPRFVYVSSAGAKPGGDGSYLGARWAVEQRLIESQLPYTIARPSFITGRDRDEDRPAERFGAAMSDGFLRIVGALGAKRVRDRYLSTTNAILGTALVRLAFDANAARTIVESEDLR